MSDAIRDLFYCHKTDRLLWFWHQILHFPQLFQGWAPKSPPPHQWRRPTPVLVGLPLPAFHYPLPTSMPPSSIAMAFLKATTGELLPSFFKGLSTLFPTNKAEDEVFMLEIINFFLYSSYSCYTRVSWKNNHQV